MKKKIEIDDATIERLKEEHGEIFLASVSGVRFVFRKPRWADAEMYSQASRRSPLAAAKQLFGAVIVHPQRRDVLDAIKDAPMTMARFVDQTLTPFLDPPADETETTPL